MRIDLIGRADDRPRTLLQKLIEPEDVATIVLYLSSPQAPTTPSAAIRVDGGCNDSVIP